MKDPKDNPLLRFVVAFLIVATMIFLLEIVPLHYGEKAIPWSEMMTRIENLLPKRLVIALLVAAFLGFGARKKEPKEPSPPGND